MELLDSVGAVKGYLKYENALTAEQGGGPRAEGWFQYDVEGDEEEPERLTSYNAVVEQGMSFSFDITEFKQGFAQKLAGVSKASHEFKAVVNKEVAGAEALVRRVPETLPKEVLEAMGAVQAQQAFADVPLATVDELAEVDAVIFGTPTRYGMMAAQMKQFLDATGQLWMQGRLVGKVGSVFTSAANQHGGLESTILSFHTALMHHGMVIVGLPYSFQGQMGVDEIKGGSPYGASTIAGGDGSRMPSEQDLAGARFQGRHVAEIASKLVN